MSLLSTSDMRPGPSSTMSSCLSGDRSIASRPKLTLQTTALPRTFGSSTTGLSFPLAGAAGASPTVRNTFKNAYDASTPSSATASPSKGPGLRISNNKPISPYIQTNMSNPSLNQNTHLSHRPYQQPLGVRSILRNSPLDTASRRRSGSVSAGASGPAGAGARRVFFPAKKQVSYHPQLEEEIRTVHYTAQHIDLIAEEDKAVQDKAASEPQDPPADNTTQEDSDTDTDSSLSILESSTSEEASADEESSKEPPLSKIERKRRRTIRIERQVRAVALLDGIESDPYASTTPPTPHQGRAKRRREWKWTLGPLDTSPVSLASSTTTPESLSASSACSLDQAQSGFQKCSQ